MAHLSNVELVDSLAPGAAPAAKAHLVACEQCRQRAGELRATMLLVGEVGDPEPPPDFWPLFAARVSNAIREDASARERAGLFVGLPQWRWLAAAVSIALLAVAAAVVLQRGPGGPAALLRPSADRVLGVDLDAGEADAGAVPVEQDEAWALLVEAGADVDWDAVAASGFVPAPGSVEGAVTRLTEAERAELARLLEVALGGNPE